MNFNNIVRSEAELRELMGDPIAPPVVEKTLTSLDRHCFAFIGRAPFVFVASRDAEGRMDTSPKGDAPGFIKVLDSKTLVIPDRPGNQRFDTFRNLFESPRIELIFLVPGKRETLRISGSAEVVRDAELLETMVANGRTSGAGHRRPCGGSLLPLREVHNPLAPLATGAVAVDRWSADARRDDEGCCFNPGACGGP